MTLPAATRPFVEFPAILRQHGFAVSPDQTIGFVEAVGLLGPRGLTDIHAAGRALLAVPRERHAEFDALFRAYFMGQAVIAPSGDEDDEDVEAHEATGTGQDVDVAEEDADAGTEAISAERLAHRQFSDTNDDTVLRDFARLAPARLPRRLSYRRMAASHGDRLNMRRALRDAVRRDGEVLTLPLTRRRTRQRRSVLLVDVSGSMRDRTEASMRFAHAFAQVAHRFEAFTFGTRLTRITPALRLRQRAQALERIGGLVADFDGGTRIGEALTAFLSVPRYAGFARGAAVLVLSDGLERGTPDEMIHAVQRLARLSWRLDWLTPLSADKNVTPQTEALMAVRPWIDSLSGGADTGAIARHVLNMAQAA